MRLLFSQPIYERVVWESMLSDEVDIMFEAEGIQPFLK